MRFKALIYKRRNEIFAIAHQLLMAGYGFGILLLLYRTAGKEEIGRWLVFISAVSLMDMLLHGFLQTPVILKLSKTEEDVNRIGLNALIFAIAVWAVLSAAVLSVSFFWHSQLLLDLRWYPLLGFLMVLYNLGWWLSHGLSEFGHVLIQRFIFCAVSLLAILLFYYRLGRVGLSELVLAQIAGYFSAAALSLLFIRKLKLQRSLFDKKILAYFLHYGKITAGSMTMGSLLRNADIFMIAGFIGPAAVAVYAVAQKMVELFEVVLRGMAAHSLPEFCRLAPQAGVLRRKYYRVTGTLLLMFLLPAAVLAAFPLQLLHLISGTGAYAGSALILRIFMLYVPFLLLDRMTGVVLEALGMARYNLVKTVLLAAVNTCGNAVALWYFHSIAGVAAVSILAALSGFLAGLFFLVAKAGMPLFDTRPVLYEPSFSAPIKEVIPEET